jgi:hypothetical protein
MNRRTSAPAVRHGLLALVSLAGIHFTAPWGGLQAVLHAMLVLGLAPEFRSPLVAVLWAAGAGWVLEGSLRLYPHLGGTALANMSLCLLIRWTLMQWPPRERNPYWGRMAAMLVLHALLVHAAVRLAAGPHAWDTGVIWALVSVPLWATLIFRVHRPFRS